MAFWDDKKILVAGGAGFLGSFIINKLKEKKINGRDQRDGKGK
jgi:nucleoside-diphosphate-sugar epimerase